MTYRIKKLKDESGWNAIPIDPRVSQWNAARDTKTNTQHIEVELHEPKVTERSGILPPFDELRNCTTCVKGRKLPEEDLTPDQYARQCRWDIHTHRGNCHFDNDCTYYVRMRNEDILQ